MDKESLDKICDLFKTGDFINIQLALELADGMNYDLSKLTKLIYAKKYVNFQRYYLNTHDLVFNWFLSHNTIITFILVNKSHPVIKAVYNNDDIYFYNKPLYGNKEMMEYIIAATECLFHYMLYDKYLGTNEYVKKGIYPWNL